jgi:hypothetical protein
MSMAYSCLSAREEGASGCKGPYELTTIDSNVELM